MTQKVFIGTNSIDSIDTVINDLKIKTVLLVTGKNSYNSNNINDKLTSNLLSTNITRFNDFSVNPKIEDTIKGIKIFNQ